MTSGKCVTVLIVEDEFLISLQLTYILEDYFASVSVVTAANGEEGLHKTQQHQPDLIITDLAMPKMDGYNMVKLIRQDEKGRIIPIIGISASDPADVKASGFLKLCDDFLNKPFVQHEVVDKVSSLLPRTVLKC